MNENKIQTSLQQLKQRLIARFGDRIRLYLFGSVARGTYEPLSDIDVMVLIDGPVDYALEEEVISIAYPIELEYDVVFGIVVYSREFWDSPKAAAMPFRKNVEKEGVLL